MTTYESEYPWGRGEPNDRIRVFLTQGDFARGQRSLTVISTWVGSFATGQRTGPSDFSLHV